MHKPAPTRLATFICLLTALAASAVETPTPAAGRSIFADSLFPGAGRPAGTELSGLAMAEGGSVWVANKGVMLAASGAIATTVGGAHHVLPPFGGRLLVRADLCASGCGFAGLAVGRGNLSGDFWVNNEILFYTRANGKCGLMVSKLDWTPKLAAAASKLTAPTNRLELVVDTVARTLTARVNGTTVLDAAALPPVVKVDNLTAAGFRFNEPVIAGAPSVSAYRAEVLNTVTAGLEPVDLGMVFVMPDQLAALRWKASVCGSDPHVPCLIRDYSGNRAEAGTATRDDSGMITVTRAFTRGYHEISFPDANQTFGIVSLEPHAGPADPFFGIDAGLTWLEQRPNVRTNMAAAMKRVGIAVARERLSLGSISPKPGVFNWDVGRKPESMRAIYRAAGVEVLEMMWGTMAQLEPGLNGKHPQNLIETAALWSQIVARFAPTWAAYEVGNEPDLDMPAMPADQYLSAIKAGAIASDRVSPRKPVVGGVFATVPPGPYFDTCVANGMLDTVDAVSFHQYDRAPAMQGQVQAYRDWVAANGHAGMPLWLTECGHFWPLGLSRPPREPDADSAREISAKAVEARACGIHTFFPFVMTFYEEGGSKSFSMFGRECTPLRSWAAYAWCAAALSGRDYIGDLRVTDPNIRLARVFAGSDGARVAVLYSDKLDSNLCVRLPLVPLRITGADGRTLQAAADGTVPLPDALGYVWLDGAALTPPALNRDTPAARLLAASRQPSPARPPATPVALQFSYHASLGQLSRSAYHLSRATAASLPLTVRVQNLGDVPATVAPVLHVPGPQPRDLPHAAITVAPHAIAEVSWTVDVTSALDICEIRYLRITAASEQTPNILPLALPMLVDGELDDILTRFPKQERVPIAETSRWKVRTGAGTQTFSSPDGKTWRMEMTFTRLGDAWAFPYFTLPKPIDPHVFCGIVLRARVLQKADNNMLILVEGADRRDIRANDLYVADGQWHSVYVPFDQLRYFTPGMQNEPLRIDQITTLSVGCVSRVLANALEVSDLILVGKKP